MRLPVLQHLAVVFLLAVPLLASASAQSEELPILETATLERNGYCRLPGWVNYRLSFRTLSDPFEGRIRIEAGGDYGTEVKMPVSSVKEVVIPVMVRAGSPAPKVMLETLDGEVHEGTERALPPPTPLGKGEILVGIAWAEENAPEWLDPSRYLERAKTLVLPPADLPVTAAGYEPFDILVLPSGVPLQPEAREAVRTWMQGGGVLVLPTFQRPGMPPDRIHFPWIFPGVATGGPQDASRILGRWGELSFETSFLERLGVDPDHTRPSPFGEGRLVFCETGAGGLVFQSRPLAEDPGAGAPEETLQAFWRTVVFELLRFGDHDPPNPQRKATRISISEPRLYRFFETAKWPPKSLKRTEALILGYAGFAVLSILLSLAYLIKKRLHFLCAGAVSLAGVVVILVVVAPRNTAVGETLDLVALKNGRVFASHKKLMHVAAFAPSKVDCSFPDREWAVQPVTYLRDDLDAVQPKWTFGTTGNPKELAVKGITLKEGGRFLVMVSKARSDLGCMTARWDSPTELVLVNRIKHPLTVCLLIRDGRALPLLDFRFGDSPRTVDLTREWKSLPRLLAGLQSDSPEQVRVLKAFVDGYYKRGEIVFTAFVQMKEDTFRSDDVKRKHVDTPFVHMVVPAQEP
ncbi:MAG: hypothetical protein ACYTFG_15085 [Planctomycetota bacterium]|jgi:hypothetical protein